MSSSHIRNFCIIAHIDHGKSTLADRFLEITETVSKRDMKSQLLDSMDLERERGITIKLTPVRMSYVDSRLQNTSYTLNLIDTPGHVDFSYEVSRSLAAVEGAILLVDAIQGVQAQTIGNLYLAMEQNLAIIPVVNKIDMPIANVEKTIAEIIHLLGCAREEIILASGKTGEGVAAILAAVIDRVPPPVDRSDNHPRALIFDSAFNEYKGVLASIRVMDGQLKKGDRLFLLSTQAQAEILELGYYAPQFKPTDCLENGQIGYVVTGLKHVQDCRVGDTLTTIPSAKDMAGKKLDQSATFAETDKSPASGRFHLPPALPGYKEVTPMVFAGIFPQDGNTYLDLRGAIEKLKLNDASLMFEPEHSQALGFGFRCGFLGMLHLDIFQERLRREHGLSIIITVPSVAYQIITTKNEKKIIHSPQEMPDASLLQTVLEPWMKLDIITPKEYVGKVMGLITERRGRYLTTDYLSTGTDQRALLHYEIPLASLVTDFYDKLKTISSGYASMNYEYKDNEPTEVVKLTILVADEPVEALTTLVWKEEAYQTGKKIVESLKESLPQQQFVLKIQAAIGGKVIASEHLSALRKDVLAKMSGGDYTRKMKLLQKQKRGKSRMLQHGKVEIPTEAYLAVLKR